MGTFTKDDARVRTKRTWLLVASLVVAVVGFTPAVGLSVGGVLLGGAARLGLLAYVAYLGGFVGLMHAWNRWWLERRGRVRADESGLWLDDTLIARRSTIRHGHVLRRDGNAYVRLGRMLRLVDIAVADEDEGQALLTAMRLDAARSVGQYPMSHGTYRSVWLRVGLIVGLWVLSGAAVMFVARSAELFLATLAAWAVVGSIWGVNQHVRVSVGADGVRVGRLLGRARFVPFSALQTAETDGRNVTLRLRDGTLIQMHHPAGKGWKPLLIRDRADEGRMLVERINAQIDNHARPGGDVRALARAGRDTRAWLREVTLASDEHASFRAPAVPPDELWRIAEDPAAASTARAGAALALRSRLDEDGRARLRVLADACAAPRLRVALQRAASTDELAELEDAFDTLEDDAQGARARR